MAPSASLVQVLHLHDQGPLDAWRVLALGPDGGAGRRGLHAAQGDVFVGIQLDVAAAGVHDFLRQRERREQARLLRVAAAGGVASAGADQPGIPAPQKERAEEIMHTPEVEDVSVFPMAMPMIAGPGSIATVMLLMAHTQGTASTLVILAALASVMLLTFAALAASGPIMKVLGARVEAVVTRLLGVLLAALAAQYVIDGLRAVLH